VEFDNKLCTFTVWDDAQLQNIVDKNGWIGLRDIESNQSYKTIFFIKNNSTYFPVNIKRRGR